MNSINQKDYLKKYLKIGKQSGEKRKKKKSKKRSGKGFKIIDDDLDTVLSKEIQDDLDAANEDAPQIVAVIDERPPSMRVDEKTKSNLWQPIGEATNISSEYQNFKINSIKLLTSKQHSTEKIKDIVLIGNEKGDYSSSQNPEKSSEADYSSQIISAVPPKSKNIENYYSPSRKRNDFEKQGDDYSPLRKKDGDSPTRKLDKDYSPPRKREKNYLPPRTKDRDSSPMGKPDEDYSPPRKREKDYSPPRKRGKNYSPPRRNRGSTSPRKNDSYKLTEIDDPLRGKSDEDYSPSRKKDTSTYKEIDSSLVRTPDKDYSPPRKRDSSPLGIIVPGTDLSPKKRDYSSTKIDRDSSRRKDSPITEKDSSPHRKRDKNYSPPRKTVEPSQHKKDSSPVRRKKSRWGNDESPSSNSSSKPGMTMSGKKSGLQNAQNLVEDISRLQKQEEELFRTMSSEVSGVNAATVVRRKKQEEVIDPEKEAREKELKEKYSVWGKGIKQVQDESEKFAEQQREMNKPLARYADDQDLERYLKEQEREGDPMLAYIRKKKKKVAVEQGVPEKPTYMGDFMPNRFGIRPGYRWDGVDRSNGYEKKWFQVESSKKAMQDEALKWSTEDM